MRIGILSPISIQEFLPYLDDVSQEKGRKLIGLRGPAVDSVAHELLQQGHSVVIFTLDVAAKQIIKLVGHYLTIYVGEYRSDNWIRGITFFEKEIRQLQSCVELEKCEVLHAHWTYEFALGALKAKCPIVVTVRDVATKILNIQRNGYRMIRWLMNQWVFMHRSKFVIVANSTYVQQQIRIRHGVDAIVIPNPVSQIFLIDIPRRRKGNIIVSIANGWTDAKNIDSLIIAFMNVRSTIKEAELWLIGPDFYQANERVESILQRHPRCMDGVRLLGRVEHDVLPLVLSNVDLMVHPSLEESFGNPLIEAMAQGIPVIGGADSGAVPYVLDSGHAGALCDITSPDAIARVTIEFLADLEMWSRYSEAGRLWVLQNFTVKAVTEKTITVYHEACITVDHIVE